MKLCEHTEGNLIWENFLHPLNNDHKIETNKHLIHCITDASSDQNTDTQ